MINFQHLCANMFVFSTRLLSEREIAAQMQFWGTGLRSLFYVWSFKKKYCVFFVLLCSRHLKRILACNAKAKTSPKAIPADFEATGMV